MVIVAKVHSQGVMGTLSKKAASQSGLPILPLLRPSSNLQFCYEQFAVKVSRDPTPVDGAIEDESLITPSECVATRLPLISRLKG